MAARGSGRSGVPKSIRSREPVSPENVGVAEVERPQRLSPSFDLQSEKLAGRPPGSDPGGGQASQTPPLSVPTCLGEKLAGMVHTPWRDTVGRGEGGALGEGWKAHRHECPCRGQAVSLLLGPPWTSP